MNGAIEKHNSSGKGICLISEAEFLVGLGLLIGAVEYGSKGSSFG